MMDHPSRVLSTLDRHLDHKVSLVIYGRAALCLGFDHPLPEFSLTEDVDGIIRMSQLEELVADDAFWDAVDTTNRELEPAGLFITHLFQEDQVFLRKQWERHVVALARPPTRFLELSRPATVDLILSKMMRGDDEQDMADIAFMVRHDEITPAQMEAAFHDAVLPDIPELMDAYAKARPLVRDIVRQ